MLIFRTRRHDTILVAGMLAGIVAVGCSKEAGRAPTLEAASSAAAPASAADSAQSTDTAAATTPAKAVPKPTPADTPAKPRPPVKPNIDPARNPPTTLADTSKAAAAAPAAAGQDQWLKYDAASNTVTFQLIGGPHGFQFNGYSNGEAALTLPSKANVVINFINKDGTPHSAEVISGDGPIPNAGGDPAIPRAYTNQLLQGLPQEATDAMRFQVPQSGTYRIFCGVPGHGLSGMWIWMKVDPAVKAPSFGPTKG
jgi:plastocyanin